MDGLTRSQTCLTVWSKSSNTKCSTCAHGLTWGDIVKISFLFNLRRVVPREKNRRSCENGFATAEWIILVGFTIVLMATMVQGLYIENVRQTTFAFLNDAARTGARFSDVRQAFDSPSPVDNDGIENACEARLRNSIQQSSGMKTSSVNCVIGVDTASRVYVEASVGPDFKDVQMLPGAEVAFKPRLNNLKQRYYPSEAAK